MIKKTSILLFILLGLLTAVTYGQKSSSASMQISARVIKPVGISSNTLLPNKVDVHAGSKAAKGVLKLQGTEQKNAHIDMPNSIVLTDDKGNMLELDIQLLDTISQEEKEIAYTLNDSSTDRMPNGKYNGEMKTSIVYL